MLLFIWFEPKMSLDRQLGVPLVSSCHFSHVFTQVVIGNGYT